MSKKINGTMVLDGLIEGNFPAEDKDFKSLIEEWVGFAASNRFTFHPEIKGQNFSLLADNTPFAIDTPGAEERLKDTLEELLRIFPKTHAGKLFSTVRSLEYQQNIEIQTLYGIAANGEVVLQSREIEAETVEEDKPLSRREKIGLGLMGVLLILVLVFASTFLIDYKKVFTSVKEDITPLSVKNVSTEIKLFSPYLSIIKVEKRGTPGRENHFLLLTLKRSELFPDSRESLEEEYQQAESLHERLILESLAKGYLTYECFDAKGQFFKQGHLRIADLWQKENVELTIAYENDLKPARILFTYY